MAEPTSGVNNGVNVAALIAAREALTKAPAAAQFKWRAACEWKNGTHSHSTVEGFYGCALGNRGDTCGQTTCQPLTGSAPPKRWHR